MTRLALISDVHADVHAPARRALRGGARRSHGRRRARRRLAATRARLVARRDAPHLRTEARPDPAGRRGARRPGACPLLCHRLVDAGAVHARGPRARQVRSAVLGGRRDARPPRLCGHLGGGPLEVPLDKLTAGGQRLDVFVILGDASVHDHFAARDDRSLNVQIARQQATAPAVEVTAGLDQRFRPVNECLEPVNDDCTTPRCPPR